MEVTRPALNVHNLTISTEYDHINDCIGYQICFEHNKEPLPTEQNIKHLFHTEPEAKEYLMLFLGAWNNAYIPSGKMKQDIIDVENFLSTVVSN